MSYFKSNEIYNLMYSKNISLSQATKEYALNIFNEEDFNKEEVQFIKNIFESFDAINWSHTAMYTVFSNLTEEQYKFFYLSNTLPTFFQKAIGKVQTLEGPKSFLFKKYKYLWKDILDHSKDEQLIRMSIQNGMYRDINDIDKLVFSQNTATRQYVLGKCSIEKLSILTSDPEVSIRKNAYIRLGIYENMDKMLEDKAYQIRLLAAENAPMYYPKFKDMIEEPSKYVFMEVARKIEKSHLPYLLGNKNCKQKMVSAIINERMNDDKEL